jgi:hypothetical protein
MKKTLQIFYFIMLLSVSGEVFAGVYNWSSIGEGTNGNVNAVVIYNNRVIVAGGFSRAGTVVANNVAAWYDDLGWQPLGSGLNDTVYALAVYDNELIAAGRFTNASRIAKWNGTSWVTLGLGMNDDVRTLMEYNGNLYAAGLFNQAGGLTANHIAFWDGANWQSAGSGLNNGLNNDVFALAVFNNKLIVGGKFTKAGQENANYIASWDFSSWQPLGDGLNDRVQALNVHNNELIAGGRFTQAGSFAAKYIAKWDGVNWLPLSNGVSNWVYSLASYKNELIVGGSFKYADSLYCDRIVKWNGVSWSRLLTGMNAKVNYLLVYDTNLYAAGDFTTAGGKYANHIALWNNQTTYNISGRIRFYDNNNPVDSGKVKAVRIDVNTREIIVLDSCPVNSGGLYTLRRVPGDSIYIITFPSDDLDGPEDYIPTYYPSSIDWRSAIKIFPTGNLTNIDIRVYRINPGGGLANTGFTISGHVYLNFDPLNSQYLPYKNGAIIYVKQGSDYRRYSFSNNYEQYRATNLLPGSYDMFVYRIGYASAFKTVVLGSSNIDTIDFYLDTVSLIGIKQISSNVPQGYSLGQNYPNPFNPSTKINFEIPEKSAVKLVLYDVLGKEVKTLVNEVLSAGRFEVTLYVPDLSTGVYFYRFETESYAETKKMLLIK